MALALAAAGGFALLHRDAASPAAADLERQLAGAGQFSSELEMETSPRFASDGTRVAFALGNDEHARIVVQDIATRTRSDIVVPGAILAGPTFFPDGLRLAYHRRVGKACSIVERDLATGAERVLDSQLVRQLIPGTSRVLLQASPGDAVAGSLLLSIEATGGSPVAEISEIAIE